MNWLRIAVGVGSLVVFFHGSFERWLNPAPNAQVQALSSGAPSHDHLLHEVNVLVQNAVPTTAKMAPQVTFGSADLGFVSKDQSFWRRENEDFYLSAQTLNPTFKLEPSLKSTPLMDVRPTEKLYLFAYSPQMDIAGSDVHWFVNSSDAVVTGQAQKWFGGNRQEAAAIFIARRPGIYTVQAEDRGVYSVPMVLTVGLDDLKYVPAPRQLKASPWVILFHGKLPTIKGQLGWRAHVQYFPYPVASDGYLPIVGDMKKGKSVVVAIISKRTHREWTYELPIAQNGDFRALVRVPFRGRLDVAIIPHFLRSLNKTSGYETDAVYTVDNSAPSLQWRAKALLPSAISDYNLSPVFQREALLLAENAPTEDAAIAAISNYVSDVMKYDVPASLSGKIIWQDAVNVWKTRFGVCQDYSSLASSMLRSVGIPTQTIIGGVGPRGPFAHNPDDHEWLEAWDGTKWILFDPTFDSPGFGNTIRVPFYVDNEYFTNTDAFIHDHWPDRAKIGTDQ